MTNDRYPFVNLPLPYAYDALEPFIDAATMEVHHRGHLQAYIDKLNALLAAEPRLQGLTLPQLIRSVPTLPPRLRTAIRDNAGGVYNHRLYFSLLTPEPKAPTGMLSRKIEQTFGGMKPFTEQFTAAGMSVFGSGYAWLAAQNGTLSILTTPNQNTPLGAGVTPLLVLDVWEHAYYLKHQNRRADYIRSWFRVLNWNEAERRLHKALTMNER